MCKYTYVYVALRQRSGGHHIVFWNPCTHTRTSGTCQALFSQKRLKPFAHIYSITCKIINNTIILKDSNVLRYGI